MNRLLTSILVSLVAANTALQADPSRPRLVVGIVVDQLRSDYIDGLRELFGEKGFRRLIDNGVYLKDVDFKAPVSDPTAATALLYTGAYPAINGISGARIFDPSTLQTRSSMFDSSVMGNSTTETLSPVALRVSTLADELVADGAGLSQIFSIAPDAEQALAMTGHAGTSAVWIDDNTGKWSSTTYYRDNAKNISRRNRENPLSARLDTMRWEPAAELTRYPDLPAQKKYYPFRYRFSEKERDAYDRYKSSPLVNEEVTDVAIDYLTNLKLGDRGDVVDMINVGYTAEPWPYVADGDPRLELEDSYLRLDRQLGRLLDAIDAGVGLDNTLIFLSSTGYYSDPSAYDPKYRVPTGDFSVKRALSLLNAFLSAKYGNGQYVSAFSDGGIHLNGETLEVKKLDPAEVSRAARDFLTQMAGVAEVRTYREILASASAETEAMRLGIDPRTAADIYLRFTPGWNVVDDSRFPVKTYPVRDLAVSSPAFILAPGLKKETIPQRVEATALTTTIANAIRIRAPNGASTRPLLLNQN